MLSEGGAPSPDYFDLKQDSGREAFLRLCDGADVLVEAFSPGTMERIVRNDPHRSAV